MMERVKQCVAMCKDDQLAGILVTAGKAALEAGKILKNLYGKPHDIKHKGAIDLVTEADVASEEKVLEILQKAYPDVAVLAEESHSQYDKSPEGAVWIIDPLDGTTNFAHNFPWFGVSIAYAVDGLSKVGVIYSPILDELFCACSGSGVWLNGESIKVSSAESLNESLLATGFPYAIKEKATEVLSTLEAILPQVQGIRRAGAAALDMAYVACGRLDGFWEIHLKPWDTAAGMLLIEEAGGKLSDYKGNTYSPFVPEVLASNGKVHHSLVELLAPFSSLKN